MPSVQCHAGARDDLTLMKVGPADQDSPDVIPANGIINASAPSLRGGRRYHDLSVPARVSRLRLL
jgi:hypothetical protein